MLHEAQRVTGAAAASFLGTEPGTVVHAELPAAAGDAVTTAWRTALYAVREPVSVRPGLAWPLPWPAELDELGYEAAVVVPAVDEGLPRVWAHLVLYHHRAPALGGADLAALRPVTDLIVTAVRTSALLTASARQAAEQSLRAVQGEILRQISTAVLVDPALDRTLAAITEQLQQGAGYERVQVLLDPDEPAGPGEPGRAAFPLVAQGRHLGALVIETARELDPSERELLRMFSESVALIVRNANLHGELSEAKSFLENLIQSATESIVAVDPAGRVVTWNPAAERLFGRGPDEARGKLLGDAYAGGGDGPARAGAGRPAGQPDGGAASPAGGRPRGPGPDGDLLAHPVGRPRRDRSPPDDPRRHRAATVGGAAGPVREALRPRSARHGHGPRLHQPPPGHSRAHAAHRSRALARAPPPGALDDRAGRPRTASRRWAGSAASRAATSIAGWSAWTSGTSSARRSRSCGRAGRRATCGARRSWSASSWARCPRSRHEGRSFARP